MVATICDLCLTIFRALPPRYEREVLRTITGPYLAPLLAIGETAADDDACVYYDVRVAEVGPPEV